MSSSALRPAACLALLLAALPAAAADTVAVLSSNSGAYLEAFSAFQAAYGREVPHLDASRGRPELPPRVRTVVAFGSKAAGAAYPADLNLVYTMAPALFLDSGARRGRTVKVSMIPELSELFARIKLVQPSIKRLTGFWSAPSYGDHATLFAKAAADAGLEVRAAKVESLAALPALLRAAKGTMDAFWLPPDPLLMTPETLMIFREFSWNNGIPMYASTRGLAREGACAAIGSSFSELGAAAGKAALGLDEGAEVPALIYPGRVEFTLNSTAARRTGLTFSAEALRQADFVIP